MADASSLAPSTSTLALSSNASASSAAFVVPEAGVEPLYQVKLLSALRSGDPALVHPFLAEIGKDRRKSNESDHIDTAAAALHLAVRCASVQTVSLLLSHRAISPNGVHPPGSGTTALHLAASLGRVEIVNLLLEQDGIDDTLRDSQGRSCKDVARNKEVIRAIDDSRAFLNASYRSLLRSYILSPPTDPPSPALLNLLSSPRIRFVDLSYLDDDSGSSVLHEAAKRKDLRLIELAVRAGADVFVRNRRGKLPGEGAGKEGRDDRVKVFLKQFANHDRTLMEPQSPLSEPPVMKGYLNKYANVARGYNPRWFVLKGGVLSYYTNQSNETVISRGSISMKTAVLKTSGLRFEVHSLPASRPNAPSSSQHHVHATQKWYLKATDPGEASRWAQAIRKSIEWCQREESEGRRKSGESDSSAARSLGVGARKRKGTSLLDSLAGSSLELPPGGHAPADASPNLLDNGSGSVDEDGGAAGDADDGDDEGDTSSNSAESGRTMSPPYEENFELHGNALQAQMELTAQLLSGFNAGTSAERQAEVVRALRDSMGSVQGLLGEYISMTRKRETWLLRKLKKEQGRQRVWEESLATVVKEGEALEQELRLRSRMRGSRVFSPSVGRKSGMLLQPTPPPRIVEATTPSPVESLPPAQAAAAAAQKEPLSPATKAAVQQLLHSPPSPPARSYTADTITPLPAPASVKAKAPLSPSGTPQVEDEEDHDTDEEDEFFDAIESNTLPNLLVHESIVSPVSSSGFSAEGKRQLAQTGADLQQYMAYEHLRTDLNLSEERPNTSLWSVLKHSIGKDLTKISFPVFFNEPTSMLQRMAEDMEFSECLDIAAEEKDPLRRIAFVGAFAMSNYSSTIGRIAKPFNPMLSETFEYVRLDKKYRYVSEQVSHHPPISACWSESPTWHYYGEVDAQNKFMGKSFEIRPTGVAHAELIIPEERGPGYPRAPGKKSMVVEHYSWKKVTTNVSGFILGSPTIDHYGDMVIKNHRTGDQCILTFKPRGWRGKDAFEISGQVIDSRGSVAYDIAGRWNSQLVAKQHGAGHGLLHPDISISPSGTTPEYILLWRNSDKPPGSPFNLTPFAITLNDCPRDTLKPYLCPTDCRLRPDQRAFEMGKYEIANGLKHDQEEKQRSIRKAREEGRMPPHKPRWFRAETDGDTGERVWTPARVDEGTLEYWAERERVWKEGGRRKTEWSGVEPIFIEEPDFISEKIED